VFPLIYHFMASEPPSWMAYVQWACMMGLMGLTYLQVTRRGMGFMLMFGTMLLIFFVDLLAYLPFLGYILWRDRRAAVAAGK
jgi:hypothetical protein